MKSDHSRAKGTRTHEGCDVELAAKGVGTGDTLDVRLEPKAADVVESFEDDTEHVLTAEQWAAKLREAAPDAFGDRPKPRQPALVQPGTEAKIQIMQARIARNEDPFGPLDLTTDSVDESGREIRRCRNGRDERGALRSITPSKGDAA